jgi:hypothetical protein
VPSTSSTARADERLPAPGRLALPEADDCPACGEEELAVARHDVAVQASSKPSLPPWKSIAASRSVALRLAKSVASPSTAVLVTAPAGSTVPLVPPVTESGCLLIADISGYTDYVVTSPLEYAEDVVADITRDVVRRLEPVVRVNKLEGDAAFGYALEDDLDASMLFDSIEECYFGFRRRLRGIEHSTSCSCNACAKAPALNLKFVVHYGEFIRRGTNRGEELTGHDVILVHRLLKNTAAEVLGLKGYVLCTEACVNALGVDPVSLGMTSHAETYPDVGEVPAWVVDLESRWDDELERSPVFVAAGDEAFAVGVTLPVAQSVAWEYLTAPAKRLLWQVDRIEQVDEGGRRCTGSSTVCVDGRSQIYEEILDWRPFDYLTERVSLPGGVGVVLTTVFEPDRDGTRVVTRGRRDGGRLAWLTAAPAFRRRLQSRYRRLAALVPAAIPEEKRLPLVVVTPPSASV